ncbi:phytase [Actinokineospora soli]|uniref:Phytase n=1 Tax=Actinokineospora soli TaxID=1048753 RepID=A0ABW2TR98_9PSEU
MRVTLLALFAAALLAVPAHAQTAVTAVLETASNYDDEAGGDADADDPAIWVHPTRPEHSLVLGTLKNGGLTVTGLDGREVQRVATPPAPTPDAEAGRFNNVDVVTGAWIGGRKLDLAVVSDRGRDRIRVYGIDPRGARAATPLTDLTSPAAPRAFSASEAEVDEQRTAYGLAVLPDPFGGAPWVVASRRSETRIGLFRLAADGAGKITYRAVDTEDLPATFATSAGAWTPCADPGDRPQVEGMVVDGTVLYAAQEDVGIWRVPVGPRGFGAPELVQKVREYGQPAVFDEVTEECVPTGSPVPEAGRYLSADAEGLAIGPNRALVASSQGDSTFAVFDLRTFAHRKTFTVGDGVVDGVQHCDGAAISAAALGPRFPRGLLVVHDGENTPSEDRENTNFKFVPLERVGL